MFAGDATGDATVAIANDGFRLVVGFHEIFDLPFVGEQGSRRVGFLVVSRAAAIIKKRARFLYKLLGIFYGDLLDSIPKHTLTKVYKPAPSCRTRFASNSNIG